MSLRTQENLTANSRDNRIDRLKTSFNRGEYIDEFTTIEKEPYEVTLARLPKCLQGRKRGA